MKILAYINFFFALVLLGAGVIFYLPGEPVKYETFIWTAPIFIFCALTVLAGARVLKNRTAGWGIAGIFVFIVGFASFLFAAVALTLRSF